MTPEQLALLQDARLSCDARICGLRIAGDAEEWAEVDRNEFRRLLGGAGKNRVAAALGELELWGYAQRRPGGRGHSDRYRFSVPDIEDAKDSVHETRTLNPDSVHETRTLKRTSSSTTSSTPSAGVREAVENSGDDVSFARLRELLSPYDEPLSRLRRTTGTTAWAADVWGWYRPPSDEPGDGGGMEWGAFVELDRDEALRALSTAISDYASEGKEWSRRYFRGFVRKAASEARRAKKDLMREDAEVHRVRDEKPGAARAFNRGNGSGGLVAMPDLVQQNLRKTAEQRAGEDAPPERVEEEYEKLTSAWQKNYAAGGAR